MKKRRKPLAKRTSRVAPRGPSIEQLKQFMPPRGQGGADSTRSYKIVGYVDEDDGKPMVQAFVLSQANLVAGRLEAAAPEALDLDPFKLFQVSVEDVETRTHISFGKGRDHDTFVSGQSGRGRAEALGARAPRQVEALADVLR